MQAETDFTHITKLIRLTSSNMKLAVVAGALLGVVGRVTLNMAATVAKGCTVLLTAILVLGAVVMHFTHKPMTAAPLILVTAVLAVIAAVVRGMVPLLEAHLAVKLTEVAVAVALTEVAAQALLSLQSPLPATAA
jgi:membrane-associated HD superfamily phosphohydrolase